MKKILIVDDEPNIVEILQDVLSEAGYEFRAAVDGKQAILAADSYRPDLVLLDVSLPEGGGGGGFKNLRQSPATRDVPVIFLSAMPPAEIQQLVDSDAHAVVHKKPFKTQELLELMSKMLGG